MLQDMISIATQRQSAQTAMAQFIINNEPSETDSEPEEAKDATYRRTSNPRKGLVTCNLNYTHNQADKEETTQMNCNRRQ